MAMISGTKAMAVSVILAAQVAAYYVIPKAEKLPPVKPLAGLAPQMGTWQQVAESKPEQEILDLLRADDTVDRYYRNDKGQIASLFIAFFKSQRAGVSPHSPKVCLPGSGWTPLTSDRVSIEVPGESSPITVNRYIVTRGDMRSLVLYWYQSHNRVVADEFAAKAWLVADAIRYQRSDTSMIRAIVRFEEGKEEAAFKIATDFVRSTYPVIKDQLPGAL